MRGEMERTDPKDLQRRIALVTTARDCVWYSDHRVHKFTVAEADRLAFLVWRLERTGRLQEPGA